MISRRGVGRAGAWLSIAFISFLVVPAVATADFMLSGRTSQGLPVRVRVSATLSTIKRLAVRWQAQCTSGALLVDTSAGWVIDVTKFPHFRSSHSYTTTSASYSAADGQKLTVLVSGHVDGNLLFNGRVRGTWSATARVLDHNHAQVDSCRTGLVRWRAALPGEKPAANISTGKTSQDGAVRVSLTGHHVVTGLIIQLRTQCTDHKRRDIWPGFEAPFRHPQDADGGLSDSYNILGRDAATGVQFRQRASFTARVADNTLTGSAIVRQTLIPTEVVCRSPRVTFSVHL
jgi:hypothetical protein